jgi:dienelactone hydrolase
MNISKIVCSTLFLVSSIFISAQDTIRTKNVEAILYLGKGKKQPLVVGIGGSEGGNAWTTAYWEKTRNQFIERGYAFLAIGYFGCSNTPEILNKIAIDDIHAAILEAAQNKKIDKSKIAAIGGSRGADLALLLGTYYKDINCVVGMSSSHAIFPGHTQEFNSSCWTFDGAELPFIPVNEEAIPFLMKRDLKGAFEAMLKDFVAEQKALIKVEKINGSVLLLSGTKDETIPAVEMGNKIMGRLKENNFTHPYEHLVFEGTHAEPTQHFDAIFRFLNTNFNKK